MLAVGTGGKGRTRPSVAEEGICACTCADADLDPSHVPPTADVRAALAVERNSWRLFIWRFLKGEVDRRNIAGDSALEWLDCRHLLAPEAFSRDFNASLTVKLPGLWRSGKSLKLAIYFWTIVCAGSQHVAPLGQH